MAQLIGGKGKLQLSQVFLQWKLMELRRTGFKRGIAEKYPDIKIVGKLKY